MTPLDKGVVYDRDKAYLGHCLHLEHLNEHIVTSSGDTWRYCDTCKIRWWEGRIFSGPPSGYPRELLERVSQYVDYTDNTIRLSEISREVLE